MIGILAVCSYPLETIFDRDGAYIDLAGHNSNFVATVENRQSDADTLMPIFDPSNHNAYITDSNANETSGNPVSVIATAFSHADTTPRHTAITSAADGNNNTVTNGSSTVSTSTQFKFVLTDNFPIASFECGLESSVFSSCNAPINLNSNSNLKIGTQHNFQVRSIDLAGNKESKHARFTWTILTPVKGIQQLIQLVYGINLNHVIQTTLSAPLNSAIRILTDNDRKNDGHVCNLLSAFIYQVNIRAHYGQLTTNQTMKITQSPYSARAIKTALGCI